MGIKKIQPSQVLNSRGEPTIKVTMVADNDMSSYFVVPGGASVGANEAVKKTDNSQSYAGKSVNECVDSINNVIAPKFIGYPLEHQQDFDSLLIALDGTENKQNLGANTILALSGAYFKLSAKLSEKPLWQYIAENRGTNPQFPRLYANLIGGGKHAPGLDIQEFMMVPQSTKPIEAIEQIVQTYQTLKTIMVSLYGPTAKLVGDEGAIAPIGARTEVVLEALSNLSSKQDKKFDIALDVAANSFFDGKNYQFEGQSVHASDLLAIYQDWESKFDIFSMEDPFAETDIEGLELLKTIPKEKKPFRIVADDYTVTNANKINEFSKENIFDAIIIKPDQVGSITEMFTAIDTAKQTGCDIIISHRSGESNDDFIVDLAYGVGASGIKIGAPARGERVAKYNRLLEIEYSLDEHLDRINQNLSQATPLETPIDKPMHSNEAEKRQTLEVQKSENHNMNDEVIKPQPTPKEEPIITQTSQQASELHSRSPLITDKPSEKIDSVKTEKEAKNNTPNEQVSPSATISGVKITPPDEPAPIVPSEPNGDSSLNKTKQELNPSFRALDNIRPVQKKETPSDK